MIEFKDLLEDSGLADLIADIREENRRMAIERKLKKIEFENKLINGLDYELEIYYNDGKSPEFISLEGFKNAFGILDVYRKIGFNLNVRKLKLTLNEEKIKVINFKY